MKRRYIIFFGFLSSFMFAFLPDSKAQCELFDFNGAPSTNPVWYSCSGNDFTLNIQSPNTIGNWSIDWGDGSPMETGASLVPPAALSHLYAEAVDIYTITFIETSTGCTVTGTLVMEEATSASIQIPVGGLTQACAPQTMEFINSSTNTSTTTVFTWDFGDGSPQEIYDHTNLGQTIAHTYQQGTVDCETVVTLTAENNCNTVQGGPSNATFNPIRIWDIDDAAITASETILCFPDNEVTYTNTTERNCLLQGNIYQRYEYWNFGDYWGLGYDSIIDWRPWPPTFPLTIEYPGIGTYTTTLLDSNLCGIDATVMTIQIVPPPTADANLSQDTICEGQSITLFNNSSTNATEYEWNLDNGNGWINIGSGNFNYVFNNPGTYDIQLLARVGSAGSGCADTVMVPLVVLPAPVADILLDQSEGCDILNVDFSDGSTGDVVDWDWDFGNGLTSNQQNPLVQSYFTSNSFNVSLTVTSTNGCVDTDMEIVTVHESPVVDFLPQDVCIGAPGSFTDLSTFKPGEPITSWNWSFGDGGTSTDQNPTHIYTATGTYYVVLEVSTAYCTSIDSLPVNVQPAPDADISADIYSGCAALTVNFNNLSTGATSYSWLFGDGSGSGDFEPTHTFDNFGTADSVYTVMMIAQSAFGCRDTAYTDITVAPNAQALYQTNYVPGCDPGPANFTNNSSGAVSYIWDFGDGSPLSNEVSPSHEFINNTLTLQAYPVELIAISPSGCNDTISTIISVYPEPDFNFTISPDSGCSPLTVQFPLVAGVVSPYWTFGDGTISISLNPQHTYSNNTLLPIEYTATLIGTSAFDCTDTTSSTVIVTPAPIAQFSPDFVAGCGPLEVTLTNQSLIGDYFTWDYGDGSTSSNSDTNHVHTYVNNTNSTVVYTTTLTAHTNDGCSNTYSRQIEVYPAVSASFDHPAESCSPLTFNFDNTSENSDVYQWNLGNGIVSVSPNPAAAYVNNTNNSITYNISLISTSMYGCEDTASSSLIVHPVSNASFVPDVIAGCQPLEVNFTNNSTLASEYEWYYGDGDTSSTAASTHSHTFYSDSDEPETFTVTLITNSLNSCRDTTESTITVYPEVVADFTSITEGCSPLGINFTNESIGGYTYFWDFGDGDEAFIDNPSHTFLNFGDVNDTLQVSMIAQSGYGCVDTAYTEVIVYPLPDVSIALNGISGCFPADVEFVNNSQGVNNYSWTYGDGEVSADTNEYHSHTYTNLSETMQSYLVNFTGTTQYGCEASDEISVEIIPEVIADINAPGGGCSPLTVNFENNSFGTFTHFWDFGDGTFSVEPNPAHVFSNSGIADTSFTVMYIAQSLWGCADTVFTDIGVFSTPQAAFIASPTLQVFPNATVDISNLSIASPDAEYSWTWGDGNNTVSPVPTDPETYTYETWGEFLIQLHVGNEFCFDTTSQSIRIDPPLPIAAFSGGGEGCAPYTTQFFNESTYGVSYIWNFGDGTTSVKENPFHTYLEAGEYTVALTVTGPGGQTDIEIQHGVVVVHESASAYFTINPPVVNIPADVYFANVSTFADEFFWDFGDGTTSTEQNPYHNYSSEGWHPVMLIANNQYNCPDTFRIEEAVLGKLEGIIEFPNAFTPSTNGSTGGSYGRTEMFNNNIFFPYYSGVEKFNMQIFNRWGELLFETNDVEYGWDGYYRNELCKQDVYVWRIKATFLDGSEVVKTGDLTLLR